MNEETKRKMSFLGAAPLKLEGGWTSFDGSPLTADQISEAKQRKAEENRRRRALEARMRHVPDVITPEWLSTTVSETLAVGLRDEQSELGWDIIQWIAEGRIKDVNGCCMAAHAALRTAREI